ncbi:MAG: signal recognition particle-docking protein FtsY [Planctomycetota bacterium]
MGLLDRLKKRLTKTREALSDNIAGLFRGGRAIDQGLLDELEELLYTSDLGALAGELTENLARQHKRGALKGEEDVRRFLREDLLARLDAGPPEEQLFQNHPLVILVVGVNGSGKTTSIAKLAHRFQSMGKRVLLGAADTFRAAAADQLEIWANRNGAEIVRQKQDGADPAAVAYDSIVAAQARGVDVLLVDTAGRLHTQSNLMAELAKVRRVIEKQMPGAPHETWLVLDGTNGQNAVQQAKLFTETVEVTGLVVSKLDGTARGGAVFAIQGALGLPVRYVGTGETLPDLEAFDPEAFVDAIISKTTGAASH